MERPHDPQTPYLNVHSHRPAQAADELAVMNIRLGYDIFPAKAEANMLFSIGLHPWDIDQNWRYKIDNFFNKFEINKNYNTLIAIGECGFDALRGPEMTIQQAVFEAHLQWAKKVNLPIIIHCVKSYDTLLKNIVNNKNHKYIIHGFDKHPQLAQSLVQAGCWLSFGKALLKPESSAAKALAIMPEDRFLLETDDAPIDIREIYAAAAAIRSREISEIRSRVWQTWTDLNAISPQT